VKKRRPIWMTKMYWCGPYVDITGKPVPLRAAWAHRLRQSATRLWTVRMRKHWVANVFFTLWVSTDVLAIINGTTPLIPLSVWGAGFGVALVVFEWFILVDEFRESAPLHVIWQPRVLQPPQQPYLYVHFESKNCLPFEVRCTFANDNNTALGSYPSEYQEFVPSKTNRYFTYKTQVKRAALDGLKGFRLFVDIAPLLVHPKLHDHWVYNFSFDESSGKFKRASGQIGYGRLSTETWSYPEEQDEKWLHWEEGL